jgi:hypothetical protein
MKRNNFPGIDTQRKIRPTWTFMWVWTLRSADGISDVKLAMSGWLSDSWSGESGHGRPLPNVTSDPTILKSGYRVPHKWALLTFLPTNEEPAWAGGCRPGSSLPDFSTLKMEAICSSQTSLYTISTRRHIPENGILHSRLRENLKSYIVSLCLRLPGDLFYSCFPYINFTPPKRATCSAHHILLNFTIQWYLVTNTNCETLHYVVLSCHALCIGPNILLKISQSVFFLTVMARCYCGCNSLSYKGWCSTLS